MNKLSDNICDKMPRISVVVVGDSESGKTQLINRFSGEKFSKVRDSLCSLIPATNLTGYNWIAGSAT